MLKKMKFCSQRLQSIISFKIALLLFGILLTLPSCEKVKDPILSDVATLDAEGLTVMTYNVYVGSSAIALLSVESLLQVPLEAATMYNNVVASDFPARAAAIATSIKAHHPHVIGLQEISLIRRQSPGDRIAGGTVPAEEVVIDFLQILMQALQTEGLNYHVAAQVENIDVEMPILNDGAIDDIRLTDFDVILARNDVQVEHPISANFSNAFTVETLGLQILRGYTAVDATVAGNTYHVVNTHLEAFTAENRIAQTEELVASLHAEKRPIILLGDFNTAAPNGAAYQALLSAGYIDVWQMTPERSGNTCCQDDALENETSLLFERIDQIFVRNIELPNPVLTYTVGDKPSDRLDTGLWPSDHAGVVAHLAFPNQ